MSRFDDSDVLQETMLRAALGIPEFRGETASAVHAWFLRIFNSVLHDFVRVHHAAKRDARREAFSRIGMDDWCECR